MKISFVKTGARRYGVHAERERAPALWIGTAPGYDDYLPHDLLHFVAEAELGLDGAVFGDLAAGGNARIFVPVDKRLVAKMWRQKRMHRHRLLDGRRSEVLAGVLEVAWRAHRAGRALAAAQRERVAAAGLDEAKLQALLSLLDGLAERWHALEPGGQLTLEWPRPEGRKRQAQKRRRRPATARR
jgi:hypothetical protein